jgi:hypothetical protein
LSICKRLKTDFPIIKMRLLTYEERLVESMKELLNNIYDPYKVAKMLKQTDIYNNSSLDIWARLKMYHIMQTKIADRVI